MKKLLLLIAPILLCISSYAATVHGTVTNTSGTGISGQNVHLVDTLAGVQQFYLTTTTSSNGSYSITIPDSAVIGSPMHVYTEACGLLYSSLHTYTGESIEVNITICGTDPGDTAVCNNVSGTVTLGTALGGAAYPAKVYLIHKSYDASTTSYVLTAEDSTYTDSTGYYLFHCVAGSAGDLLVKAMLTDGNPAYTNYLPTYKENSLTWNDANHASFTAGNNNIHLQEGVNAGGPGFIGGSVLEGANKGTGVGDPLSNHIIMLTTDADVAVAYAYSDAGGNYSFSNLAYGTYKLFGDVLGKDNPPIYITISGTTPSVTNVVFETHATYFGAHAGTTAISNIAANPSVTIIPNPATDHVSILGLDATQTSEVTLQGMNGATLYHQAVKDNTATVPVSRIAAGIYILKVNTGGVSATYKVVHQ